MSFKEKYKSFFNWDVSDLKDDIMAKNEVQANRITAITLLNLVVIIFLALLLAQFKVFIMNKTDQLYSLLLSLEFIIPAVLCFIKKGRGKWIKYVLMAGLVLGQGVIYMINTSAVILTMIVPIVLSGRYYSPKFVTIAAIDTMIMIAVGAICGVLYGSIDYTALSDEWFPLIADGTITDQKYWGPLIVETIQHSILINEIFCLLISYISITSAIKGRNLAKEEAEIITKTARISSELSLATDIQANMLPSIFPAFPDHKEFDVYAKMMPAKEVGGDFYDFFMIDDTHVAIVIADVSGKGVPAALFMVTAKTLIKDYAQLGLAPAEVFTRVNKMLCDGNNAGLFVTAWLGELDIKTGNLTYVNAGHNSPLIYHKTSGGYESLKMRPGFVLAGLDSMKYKQAEIKLEPGDKIFLYTDGITEATSINKELYGIERLNRFLNENVSSSNVDILSNLKEDIDRFSEGAEQFDDITMLILSLDKYLGSNYTEKTFNAINENLGPATDFINEIMEKNEVPMKVMNQVGIAFEEIFVNICNYAYQGRSGDVYIDISIENNEITIILKDKGIPFNPLDKEDPDITLSAEDRKIGGLGIFMTKKLMDEVEYEFKDSMNILKFKKRF